MHKLLYILAFIIPIASLAQQSWIKSSPLNYLWKDVGISGFSGDEAAFTNIAFNPLDSLPYVAFQDYANSQRVTVMKFSGTNWVTVGAPGFSAGHADYISFAFSPSGRTLCGIRGLWTFRQIHCNEI